MVRRISGKREERRAERLDDGAEMKKRERYKLSGIHGRQREIRFGESGAPEDEEEPIQPHDLLAVHEDGSRAGDGRV